MWWVANHKQKGANVFSWLGSCFGIRWRWIFAKSITATWFSDVPSLSVPSTIIPLHFRLQSSASHHRLWWLNLWRGPWGFILELGWSQRNVPKTTLDIWYLKMILTEFRISRPTDSTSVMMQLTCHWAQSNPSLVHAMSAVLHVAQGEKELSKDCTIPSSSQSDSKRYHLNSNSNAQREERECHSRSVLHRTLCDDGLVLLCCPIW